MLISPLRLSHEPRPPHTARSIYAEAGKIGDLKKQADLIKWSQASMNHAKIVKLLKLVAPLVPVTEEEFDTEKWLLNAQNGVIDLQSGELQLHNKEKLFKKICSGRFTPDAECPTWEKFLTRIFDGNHDLIRYVQKMAGYCLTGDVSEKCFFILHGEKGDNGKTVFVNTLMEVLADYAVQTPIDSLLRRKPGALSNDIVRMNKARLVSSAEANRQYYFDEALVKRLTGDDPVSARALYKEFITFRPECKIVIATNRIPRFDRSDTAFDKRVKIIPFDVSIPVEEQDKQLKDKLLVEADGILAWAVRGCLLWQKEGLGAVPVENSMAAPVFLDTEMR